MPDSTGNPVTTKDLIGRGLAFPLRLTLQGGLQLSSDRTNLEESIRLILKTNLGERVYRPNFGSRLSDLVFAPMNATTLRRVRLYVREAIERWEPRIILDSVLTEPDLDLGRVNIIINYHVKNFHDSRSLVFPFYLLPPGEEEE